MKKQRTIQERAYIVGQFEQSGQSVREFCGLQGISEHTLRYWLKRREKVNIIDTTEPIQGFSELKISAGARGFAVVLPHGLRLGIDGMATSELARLLLELDRQRHA